MIDRMVNDTLLLIQAMRYRYVTQPSKLLRQYCEAQSVGMQLMKWRRKLKEAFGSQREAKKQALLMRQEQGKSV